MKVNIKVSPPFAAFLQAIALFLYCTLIGLLLYRGEHWFGPLNHVLGPIFILLIFVGSALICALLALTYPVYLFWEKKQRTRALKIVGYTAAWLVVFSFLFIFILVGCGSK